MNYLSPATLDWLHIDLYAWNDSARPCPPGGAVKCAAVGARRQRLRGSSAVMTFCQVFSHAKCLDSTEPVAFGSPGSMV